MDTKVSYSNPDFAAVVYDFYGTEYGFILRAGSWFVRQYWYAPADFFKF